MTVGEVMNLLESGKTYKIQHQIPGVQRYARESVLQFLGYALHTGEFQFSGRPATGTCHFTASHILAIELAADNAARYVNHRAPRSY
jgi:hypothetical protein